MLYAHNEKGTYPTYISPKTLEKSVEERDNFKVDNGNVVHRDVTNQWVLYIPVSQRVETILRIHRDMGHTQPKNLTSYMKDKMWWSTMNKDIKEVLDQCEVCNKFNISKSPPKLVIPLVDGKPYKQ